MELSISSHEIVPATPTAMQTSIKQAKMLAVQHGQAFCVYTSDQHAAAVTSDGCCGTLLISQKTFIYA